MNEKEEKFYEQGRRAAMVNILMACARELGHGDPLLSAAALIYEREAAIVALREVCGAHGDNEWTRDLYLPDIINKHLAVHLDEVSP